MTDTKRDTLTRLFDAAQPRGVAYLVAIVALGHMTVKELRPLMRDSEPTINKTLIELESRGLVQRVGSGKADKWFPSAMAALVFHQKFFGASSSSSERSDQSSNPDQNQIRSEDDEQRPNFLGEPDRPALPKPARDAETESEYRIKCYLADQHYHLTGDKRAAYVDDDSILAIDFEMWLYQVGQMKRDGVKIKHPAAYALKCCQKGESARPEFESSARFDLGLKLKYFDRVEVDEQIEPIEPSAIDEPITVEPIAPPVEPVPVAEPIAPIAEPVPVAEPIKPVATPLTDTTQEYYAKLEAIYKARRDAENEKRKGVINRE